MLGHSDRRWCKQPILSSTHLIRRHYSPQYDINNHCHSRGRSCDTQYSDQLVTGSDVIVDWSAGNIIIIGTVIIGAVIIGGINTVIIGGISIIVSAVCLIISIIVGRECQFICNERLIFDSAVVNLECVKCDYRSSADLSGVFV